MTSWPHPFTRHPGGFIDKHGKLHPIAREAIGRGLTRVPPPPGTPAAHSDDEAHPFAGSARFSLCYAMTELLALGLSLPQIVPMVTTNAARMLGMEDELGSLRIGAVADVSVLADDRGRFRLSDTEGTEVITDRMLRPLFCLRAGRRYDAAAPILPQAVAA